MTVDSHPAVIDFAEIRAAVSVEPDEFYNETPWKGCDGYKHELRAPRTDVEAESEACFNHDGRQEIIILEFNSDLYKYCPRLMSRAEVVCRENKIRCEIELTPALVGLEGKRVEVVDKYGETRRFIVGKSTGWMPCHLEIKTVRSSGGGCVTGTPFKSVRVLKGGR